MEFKDSEGAWTWTLVQWLIFVKNVYSNLFSNSNHLLKMTPYYIEMHITATHLANLQKCVAFSDATLDKLNPVLV